MLTFAEVEIMESKLSVARMLGVPVSAVGKKKQEAPRIYRRINVGGKDIDLEIVPAELVDISPEGSLASVLRVLRRTVMATQISLFKCNPPVIVNGDGIFLVQNERGKRRLNALSNLEWLLSGSRDDRKALSECGIVPYKKCFVK